MVVVYEFRQRALICGPHPFMDVRPGCWPHVSDVIPTEDLDRGIEIHGVRHIIASKENGTVLNQLLLEPILVLLKAS